MLWNWNVDFKSLMQKIYKRHLWLLFPGLPIQLWSEDILTRLANHPGKFIDVDKEVSRLGDKQMD